MRRLIMWYDRHYKAIMTVALIVLAVGVILCEGLRRVARARMGGLWCLNIAVLWCGVV